MRRFLYLIEKEFKHIFRDKFMPKLIFVIPVVQLLILPWAANFDVKNINLKIADRDLSPLSMRLGQKLSASEYFTATFATAPTGTNSPVSRREKPTSYWKFQRVLKKASRRRAGRRY